MRTRICLFILLLTPLAVYFPTVFGDYGVRSDYSHLRVAQEEPSRLVKLYAAEGRPLYGALLETAYAVTREVGRLQWLRLSGLLLLMLLGLVLWRQLYQSGWNEVEAAGIGLGILLLPSAQVVVGSASGWAQALTLLLAMAGFSAVETEIERGGMKRFVALLGGCMIYLVAGLISPSNVLFALVPIAGVLLVRTGREPMSDVRWGLIHAATLFTGLLIGYLIVQSLLANGVFQNTGGLQLERNPFTKLAWFFANPMPNALALYALNDDHHTGAFYYWGAVLLVIGLIGMAYRKVTAAGDAAIKRRWFYCVVALPVLASGISLVAAERSSTYRVLFAVGGLILVLVAYSFRTLVVGSKVKPWRHYPLLAVIWAAIAYSAYSNALSLIAEPQAREWEIMRNATLRSTFTKPTRVFIVTPGLGDRSTERIYGDEFGSVSSADPLVAQEMCKAVLRERFGEKLPKGGSYMIETGPVPPEAGGYDLLIDMRRLRSYRTD